MEFPCPKCGSAMVRRVATPGESAGNEFWGGSTFPKCHSIVPIEGPEPEKPPADARIDDVCPFSSPPPDSPKGLLKKAVAAMDGIWRWSLEADEPDATDRWKPKHRRQVLDFLHLRDGERCGLCGDGAPTEAGVDDRYQ